MGSTLNFSSVYVKSYPEASPWDITPKAHWVTPTISGDPPGTPGYIPDHLKAAALAHAQRTGLNPLHFICCRNPFVLEDIALRDAHLPFCSPPSEIPSLPRTADFGSELVILEELQTADTSVVCRVQDGEDVRVLKLFTGKDASERFRAETSAYARFRYHERATAGAVPLCYGWVEIDAQALIGMPAISSRLKSVLSAHETLVVQGIVLEDLASAQPLSIRTISVDVAQAVMRSLHRVHSAHVLHGQPTRHNVLVIPAENRAIWVGFSHASHAGEASVSRQSLFAELAKVWDLTHQRLLPDSLIGWEAGPDALDLNTLCGSPFAQLIAPVRPQPSDLSAEGMTRKILLSYPEVNLFSWYPPLGITPAPRYDHRYDTEEFLAACRKASGESIYNPLHLWYANPPPTVVYEFEAFQDTITAPFTEYAPPPPLRQLPSDTTIQFLEHLCPSSNNVLMKVRIGQEDRLLKIFSCAKRPGREDYPPRKAYFETERDAYAHLVHYGACAAGAVPRCDGWLELSPAHVYDAIALVRRTRSAGFEEGKEPLWVFPIFEDGTFAAALVLEYFPVHEPLCIRNVTPHRADLTMRSMSRVHGAYVLHDDMTECQHALVVPGDAGAERVVIIDFDHSRTAAAKYMFRVTFLSQLTDTWAILYKRMLPYQRIFCEQPKHPHDVVYDCPGTITP